jgi:putative ABC transport system permease protein
MLKNYLKIGVRNLLKNKLFSLINILGMAISIASFLIISLFIYDEFQFDKHVKDVSDKYRVYTEGFNETTGTRRIQAMIPPTIAPGLLAEYPEVESYFRFMNIQSNILFEVGDKKMTENHGGYGDASVFDMFSLNLVEGDRKTALREPGTLAISHSLAKKYFGDKPALGQTIQVDNGDVMVSAVFEDFPSHSHLQLNYLLSMADLVRQIPERMQSWGWQQFHTYIQLKPGTDPAQLDAKMLDFAQRNAWPKTKPYGSSYIPHLMKMEKIHLYASDHRYDIAVRGNAQTVYILSGTALFILIIAILNFVNLSTARAVSRVKEVGVRKVVGAFRNQLVYQFISESVIIAFIALLIAGFVTELSLPALNSFTEKNIPAGIFLNPSTIAGVILFALLVGILAGAYPAFYISAYKPAHILSNRQSGQSGKTILRKGLVVLQFILSFFLITASLVVSDQHHYLRTKDMGFDKDNVLVIPIRGEMRRNLEAAKNTFSNHPNILSATLGYGLPGEAYAGDGIIDKATNKQLPISMLLADHDYLRTLGLKIIAGRDFSKDIPTDTSSAFIISESAAKVFGYNDPKDALGHELSWPRWDDNGNKEGKVIGVIRDFHLNSLKENLSPIVIHVFPFAYSTMTFRLKPGDLPATLAHVEATWKKFNAEWPFEYRFIDDNFDRMYKTEEKLSTLFTFFTAFTIFVACLGLFGLVVYSTSQRYKEISIRKVLGAEEVGLVVQLAKNYLLLIAIAFVIAIPFSYYAASEWLQKFAFRIDITPMLFVKAGLFIVMLSILTVGVQSLKAARTNPVNALKEQ